MKLQKPPKYLLQTGKIILIVAPFVWIFSRIDLGSFVNVLHNIAWWTVPLLIFSFLTGNALQGIRWFILLKTTNPELSFVQTMKYHFISMFYSTVMPSSAGQDVLRTIMISKKTGYSSSLGAIWMSRLFGLLTLALLSLYGFMTIKDIGPGFNYKVPAVISFCIVLVLFFLSFSKKFTKPFRSLVLRLLPVRFSSVIDDMRQNIYNFRSKRSLLLISFAITLINQLVSILGGVLAIRGVTGKMFLSECLAFIPVIEVISLAFPFTPNGMGIREALTAAMFKVLTLSNEQLGTYILLLLVINVVSRALAAAPFLAIGFFNSRTNHALTIEKTGT